MLLSLILSTALADGGMWLPEQIPELGPAWEQRGLELAPEALADALSEPLNAIVSLGFCSAAFISEDGLVATNHHCVSRYLQYLSDAEHPHHREGFIAPTLGDEASVGPTGRLWVVETITDVTEEVIGGIKRRTSDAKRYEQMMDTIKNLEAACEETEGRRCSVRSQFGGSQWRLYSALEIRDVRMVYAPPMSLGQFGGDVDNWQWPRHGADFALLRAYVGPDGSPADPSEDNVPFHPKHHLPLNTDGVGPGEFVMVAGYPGRTARNQLAENSENYVERQLPRAMELDSLALEVIERHRALSEEADARLTATASGMYNRRKNRQGMIDGFAREDALSTIRADQDAFLDWIRADRSRARRLLPVHKELLQAHDEAVADTTQDDIIGRMRRWADLLWVAHASIRFAEEQTKPDAERERGWQDRDTPRLRGSMSRLQASLWLPADRDLFALLLDRHADLAADLQLPGLQAWIEAQGGQDAALDRLYDNPVLGTEEGRLALLEMSPAELKASTDPWLQLGHLYEAWDRPRRDEGNAKRGRSFRLKAAWLDAKRSWYRETGRVLGDDANSTLRLTLGHVAGYQPQDGMLATPQTTLAGLIAKQGPAPFDVDDATVERARSGPRSRWADAELGDVPVNLLTTLDVTGGNSGSAVLDGQGRYVGIAFDTTLDGVLSDRLYVSRSRTIMADIRFMLWVLEGEPEAARLFEELGIPAAE